MKFPTYKELGEKVAKEALDTFEYNGKTLREWIEIIASNDGDTISRKVAIEAVGKLCDGCEADHCGECRIDHPDKDAIDVLEALPSVDEPSQVARDIARIVENEQDMRVIAQSEKRTETHAFDSISRQALLDKFEQWQKTDGYSNDEWNLLVDVLSAIKSMPPAPQLSTNLASLGTDCISRQAAIKEIDECYCGGEDSCGEQWVYKENAVESIQMIEPIPSAEPDIIYCKDCRKHNKRIGDYVEKSDGTYDWIWKGQACPLAEFRGVAQGHEFDYQFCAYGERRTE